jgi:hypothetical protein
MVGMELTEYTPGSTFPGVIGRTNKESPFPFEGEIEESSSS